MFAPLLHLPQYQKSSAFSIVGAIGIRAQLLFGDRVPNDLLLALPYIATVIGVWVSARVRGGARTSEFGELRDY